MADHSRVRKVQLTTAACGGSRMTSLPGSMGCQGAHGQPLPAARSQETSRRNPRPLSSARLQHQIHRASFKGLKEESAEGRQQPQQSDLGPFPEDCRRWRRCPSAALKGSDPEAAAQHQQGGASQQLFSQLSGTASFTLEPTATVRGGARGQPAGHVGGGGLPRSSRRHRAGAVLDSCPQFDPDVTACRSKIQQARKCSGHLTTPVSATNATGVSFAAEMRPKSLIAAGAH